MRILHAIANLSAETGGPPKACLGMAQGMARRGHDVSIHTTNFDGAVDADVPLEAPVDMGGVSVRYHQVQFPRFLKRSAALRRALDRAVPACDLVHIHSLYLYHDWAAAAACRRSGVPYVIMPHGSLDPFIWRRHRGRKRIVERLFQNRDLERAAAIHYTTEDERRLAAPFARNPRAIVVGNGIDPAEFATLPPKGRFRALHPETGDRPIVLFLGRLNFKKGLDLLAPAFGKVLAAGHDAHLVLAGPPEDMEDKTRGWLREAGALERTSFTGMISGEERLAALADAAMFVLPSYSENFGIAVAEASACGLPVVISDAVNICHDVAAAGAGLVSACDADAVAANMIALLADPVRARAMGERGARMVREKFSWDGIAGELEAAYGRVLSGTGLQS
ncbi:MAG: glycosyltransferase [Rhodospirillaceae bacterium]